MVDTLIYALWAAVAVFGARLAFWDWFERSSNVLVTVPIKSRGIAPDSPEGRIEQTIVTTKRRTHWAVRVVDGLVGVSFIALANAFWSLLMKAVVGEKDAYSYPEMLGAVGALILFLGLIYRAGWQSGYQARGREPR